MANDNIGAGENLHVKVDQNNIIFIDPNSIVDGGKVQTRNVKQENLVMYVNLEADLIERTSLSVSQNPDQTYNASKLVTVAKGTLNLMKNNNGRDFDTNWTDSFLSHTDIKDSNGNILTSFQNDSTAQSFGIESININILGGNFIPRIDINFIDVRGKTLFESPQNSPYSAFFHLPWPIFYLTVKGYYGKAIRYRLHLVDFSSKFNEGTANFDIATKFVGSTYAYINDIPLNGVLNAPYLYAMERDRTTKTNGLNSTINVNVSRNSKGYQMLEAVYEEYRQKGYVSQNFKTITLQELISKAESLDQVIEKALFEGVDAKVFAGLKEYSNKLDEFESAIKSWKLLNTDPTPIIIGNKNFHVVKGQNNKLDLDVITGTTKTTSLSYLLTNYTKILKDNSIFVDSYVKDRNNPDFKGIKFSFQNNIKSVGSYIYIKEGKYYLNIEGTETAPVSLLNDLYTMYASFIEQRNKFQDRMQDLMNRITRDPSKGIGFDPTIKNVFAVLMANADVYVRMLKDVHLRAFENGTERDKLIGNLSDESTGNRNIYPWPEITKTTNGNKQRTLMYPGDPQLIKTLKSDSKTMWPEVDFVENYSAIATKRVDPKADKEGGVAKINFIFEKDSQYVNSFKTAPLFQLWDVAPYINKSISSLLYEIWERARYITFYNSFTDSTLDELVKLEFKNLQNQITEDIDIVDILKSVTNITTVDKANKIISSYDKFIGYLHNFSPFEKLPYFNDFLPSISYLKDLTEHSFTLEQYGEKPNYVNNDSEYPKLFNEIKNYSPEEYRSWIYPFNSSTYLGYRGLTSFKSKFDLKLSDFFELNTEQGLITSPLNLQWVKNGFTENLFSNKMNIGGVSKVHILNTPYFHKQLNNEFNTAKPYSKYVGSAYLLITSLPFEDIESTIIATKNDKTPSPAASPYPNNFTTFGNRLNLDVNRFYKQNMPTTYKGTNMYAMFKELSSSHKIPYHLIVQWGAYYHRYKKLILEGTDILLTGITDSIETKVFFDNGETDPEFNVFPIQGEYVDYVKRKDVGIHPFYDDVFHQIINGYENYNQSVGPTSYQANITSGAILNRKRTHLGVNYWSNLVDNSKLTGDLYYTLLPSDGSNFPETNLYLNNNVTRDEQNAFRILWYTGETVTENFESYLFPNPYEYIRTYDDSTNRTNDNQYGLNDNYRKIIDLIGTFSPEVLDKFEEAFLDFASEKEDVQVPYKRYSKVKYDNFQDLLKAIVTITKTDSDSTNVETLIPSLITKQEQNLKYVTTTILSDDNMLKLTLGNPKDLDPHVLGGFCGYEDIKLVYKKGYKVSQYPDNFKYIKLYCGEEPETDCYLNFFKENDVELNEENVKTFRSLIHIYAGGYKEGKFVTGDEFKYYLIQHVFNYTLDPNSKTNGYVNRNQWFMQRMVDQLSQLDKKNDTKNQLSLYKGYNLETNKLEMYNQFKSFNDKWIAGNSIGQRNLIEEFLFLDKANRDIGDNAYININKLISLNGGDDHTSLYSAIGTIIEGSNFLFRALPSYTNFYGTNFNTKSKLDSSKNVAKNLFGTFLEVDYQESSPKMILQYTGPTSKHLEMEDIQDKMKFKNDSGNLFDGTASPLIITNNDIIKSTDFSKSNKVVAFEVSMGDQAQGLFKGVSLDQTTLKPTYASQIVNDRMGRSETGASTYMVDIGLFDIFRQASYSCTVTMMGCAMIQPTMYFYLKNIPMFRGSYWITEVTHSIRNNSMSTSFKGVRIPYSSLPDPKESYMLAYRALFESITNKAIAKVRADDKNISSKTSTAKQNEKSIKTSDGKTKTIDMGPSNKLVAGETVTSDSSVTSHGVSFNGYNDEKYVQKISFRGKVYLRAIAVTFGGNVYKPDDTKEMWIFNKIDGGKIQFKDIKDNRQYFYACRFDQKNTKPSNIASYSPTFYNPNGDQMISVSPVLTANNSGNIKGPVDVGPDVDGYGIALSPQLMKDLGLYDGDVVYFTE